MNPDQAPVNPNTRNSRKRRSRLAQEGLGEVRGITAPKELHEEIRAAVAELLRKRKAAEEWQALTTWGKSL